MKKKPSSTKRWAFVTVTGNRSFTITNMFRSKEFSVPTKQYDAIYIDLVTLKVATSSYNIPFFAEVSVSESDNHLYIGCFYLQKDDHQDLGFVGSSNKYPKQYRYEAVIIDED